MIDGSCGEGSGAAVAAMALDEGAAAQAEMEALLAQLAGEEVAGTREPAEDDTVPAPPQPSDGEDGSMVMSKAQLRETAERHGLDYEELLRDAEARGIQLRE